MMDTCYVPSLFWWCLLLLFYSTLFLNPFVFSTLAHFSNSHHPRLTNASDQQALLGFKSAITYDPSQWLTTTWKPDVSFCQWTGIICSRRRQRVVSLNVSSMGLQGTISPFLANLSFLTILDLHNNSLQGHIPYQLGNLFRLKMLRLSLNQLQGSIPPTLGGCRSLRNLSISYNSLIGNIPAELCILPKLQFFVLGDNNLTGTIPACLGNISSLHYIELLDNNLHGSIPSELGMLRQLKIMYLQSNNLTGQIPSSLSNCTNLLELDIFHNHVTGQIPLSLSNCINLRAMDVSYNQLTGHIPVELCSKNNVLMELYLDFNQLSGSIPASLFNCTKLRVVELGYNQLGGVVPMELVKLTQLQVLELSHNQLVSNSSTSFPILAALTNCSTLRELDLSYNHLTGRLPFSIGHLSAKMHFIDLAQNKLIGEIPPQIGNLTNLDFLDLEENFLTGAIPSSLNMLQKLERLYLGSNNLQGNIPVDIGQLKNLGLLALWGNNLSGRIPDSVANLQELEYLSLAQNQLSGNIPANLGKCTKLLLLDLSYNRLSGRIPPEVARLANLALYFNLSNNLLHGPLPSELSRMTMIQAIDISSNQLGGHIPSALGNCKELEYLNLSYNALEGPIPVSLGELQSLQDMDFSFNNLSGGIPMPLENLKMLYHLNFSFNKLSGEVPKGGIFKKIGATAFIGNLGLCGPWVSLSPCFSNEHKSVWHLKRVVILVVAIVATIGLCLFLGIMWRRNCKRHIPREAEAALNVWHRRISYAELITATDDFSDANLLGVGSFGKVYKGVLEDGTAIAVKLLNLENEGAHKSFDRECKVLGRVRHRNLIRVITSYSNLQIKALIFPLMLNGSLEKWLYPNGGEQSSLSLSQRLNIAIDIAQGLAYLHHHCFMQVIHCDLKPNNVLLGEDMTAYLIDFGIATIYFANYEESAFTSTNALKGSAGYIPPEYGIGRQVTTKGDVYSYGILLLEMLTRKKPTHDMFVEGLNLQKWVGSGFPNQLKEVVDMGLLRRISTYIEEDKDLSCLSQLIKVGLLCTKESPQERPTMMDILHTLQNIKDTFLSCTTIPKFQSDITHLLPSTSTPLDNSGEGQSSSTF
eukprot:PITA_28761